MMRLLLALWMIAQFAAAGVAEEKSPRWRWTKEDLGTAPAGWKAAKTGRGDGSVWRIVADQSAPSKSGFVLAQTAESPRGLFNLCVAEDGSYQDVEVQVAFKAVRGKDDQGGGIVWRYQDADNYYVARMNPLESNYRVYKVLGGKRTQLGTKEDSKIPAGEWHVLKIRQKGEQIECWLDGEKYLDAKDKTFMKAGKIGLWTKADAQTRFDDLHVTAIRADSSLQASGWPQFRGPNSSGRSAAGEALPEKIGPDTNMLWKIDLPPGHSSPVVIGERIYLTAERDKRLWTLALNRKDGRVLWEREAPARALEAIHAIGSHAQSTPAADEERVVSFFGSCGLSCYDRDGKLLWRRDMGPFKNEFGAGSSPVLVGDRVLLSQDHDQDSFLMALDKRSGETLWKTDRSDFLRGYCTPVVWDVAGRKQIVVAGTLRVAGYDWDSGKEVWTVRGLARTICMTPVVGDDGRLYVAGWSAGGDPGAPIAVEPFDRVIRSLDKNGNGKLESNELTTGPIAQRFPQVDLDKDGSITRAEYERYRDLFREAKNVVLAIRGGGAGDITGSHVVWKNTRHVPFCASPLYLDGLIYIVKDGGFLANLEARSGELVHRDRVPGSGTYYSSPVAGDGKIYIADERGRLSVVLAGRTWRVLSSSDFAEDIYATPALAGGRIYVRTTGHLYCFGLPAKK